LRLKNPKQYRDLLIDKPSTKEEAQKQLSGPALAFRFSPLKGKGRNKNYLVFNRDSLLRFFDIGEAGTEVVEAFLSLCERDGIVADRSKTITLGGKTFNGFLFGEFDEF